MHPLLDSVGNSFVSQTGTYPFFATALLFGSIPSVSLRWWRKWQISIGGTEQVDSRMTITDLFGLSLAAALILTVVRIANDSNPGNFVSNEAWIGLAAMAMFGVFVSIPTLTAISIFLSPTVRLTFSGATGIAITLLLGVGTFVLLAFLPGFYQGDPFLAGVRMAAISLTCIAGSAAAIALLLRKSGLRLVTGRESQSLQSSESMLSSNSTTGDS